MRLAIGSAQFGMDYGIGGEGKVPFQEIGSILSYARQAGVDLIDTAPRYGDSETIIGQIREGYVFPRIVTKTPHFPGEWIGPEQIGELEATFRQSLRRLRRSPLYAVLVHLAGDLLKPGSERLYDRMQAWKSEGLVEKIGFSVYTGEELDRVLERYDFDIVQLPINILDQRLIASGHLVELRDAGIEIQARSIFLQGLLLMEPERLPERLARYRLPLADLRLRWERLGLTPLAAAAGFIKSVPEIGDAIVGVHSLRQLQEVHRAFADPAADIDSYEDFSLNHETDLIDPRKW